MEQQKLPFSLQSLTVEEKADLFSFIINTNLDSVITIDSDRKVVEWNQASEDIFGYKAEEVLGLELDSLIIPEELRESHRKGVQRYLETGEHNVLNKRIELEAIDKKRNRFPVELTINPIHFRGDVYFTARVRNITSRKTYERELLLTAKELAHRERNSLAIVASICRQISRFCKTKQQFEFRFFSWLESYKKSHELISQKQSENGMSLHDRLKLEFLPYKERKISIVGEDIYLHRHSFLNFGLCLHEQLTNSVKHGSLSVPEGKIDIKTYIENDQYVMEWTETDGPVPKPLRTPGFGSLLLKTAFVEGMKGKFDFRFPDTGFIGRITFPITSALK